MARQLMYQERRVLGVLVQCQSGKGIPLDEFDRKYVSILCRRGLVEWVEVDGLRVYIATEAGRTLWKKWMHVVE